MLIIYILDQSSDNLNNRCKFSLNNCEVNGTYRRIDTYGLHNVKLSSSLMFFKKITEFKKN